MATILNPLVGGIIDLSSVSPDNLVNTIKTIALPVGQGILGSKGLYDKETDTILGVPLDSLLVIGTRNGKPTLQLNLFTLLKDVVFVKVGEGILN